MKERSPIPRRASLNQVYQEPTRSLVVSKPHVEPRHRPLYPYFLLGMGIMFGLYLFSLRVVLPSYQDLLDQWHYGDSRVSHIQASVYPSKTSDIYAFSVQGTTSVINVTDKKVQAYAVALKADVVIISLIDIAGNGRVDIVIHDEQQTVSAVLYNNGKGGFTS